LRGEGASTALQALRLWPAIPSPTSPIQVCFTGRDRNGRHGVAYFRLGPINLRNARHAADPRPLDEQSRCHAARDYSRAYLHHLVKANEVLGAMLLSEIT
jgi:tRNA-guanine family transglycosylase